MIIKNVDTLVPNDDMVLVQLLMPETELYEAQMSDEDTVATRYGTVVSMGSNVDKEGNCTGLKATDIVAFSEFAGYHVVTESTETMHKLVRGYDIIGKYMTEEDISNTKVIPTEDRVLVEELPQDTEGIILGNAKDPRLLDLNYGRIVSVGVNVKNKTLKEGTSVAYADYVGTVLREYESKDTPAIKMLVANDILLTID